MSISSNWAAQLLHRMRAGRKRQLGRDTATKRRFESLENRRVLAVTSNFLAGTLTINLTAADNVAVTSTAGNVLINGVDPTSGASSVSALTSLVVTGAGDFANTIDLTALTAVDFATLLNVSLDAGGGGDTYKIDQRLLNSLATVNVNDTGAAGSDSLQLTSTAVLPETIGVSATSVSRSLAASVGYTGLELLSVSATAGPDIISVTSTAAGTATTVNALGGVDAFTAIDLSIIGLAGLTINAGGDGEALTLNATTAGTVSVSGTQVVRTGNGAVAYSGLAALTVNGTGDADTINVTGTAASTVTVVNAGTGVDVFGDIDLSSIGIAGLTINAGGDGEALALNATSAGTIDISSTQVQRSTNGAVAYAGVASLAVNGSAGIDTFNVASTAVITTINAGGGLDLFAAINLTTIGAAGLTISAGGDGESLTLNGFTAGIFDVSSTQVQRSGNGAVVYSGLTNLLVNGTAAVDTFNVASTAAGTLTTIDAAGGLDVFADINLTTIGAAGLSIIAGGNGETLTLNTTTAGTVAVSNTSVTRSGNGSVAYSGLASLVVNGTGGIDTFNIGSTATGTATTINASGGLDVFGAIDLSSIAVAGLIINAGGDGKALTLNTGLAGTVNISGTQVTRVGNGAVNYSGLTSLVVNGTALIDTFNVANTAAGTATAVNAAGGLDLFAPIDLTSVALAGLTINAGGDGEALTLNTTTAGTVDVSNTQVKRSGNGPVIYFGLATLVVNGTGNADTFNITSTAGATATTINALGGVDLFGTIDLTSIGAAGLTLNAGGDGESLVLNTTTAGTVTVSNTQVQRQTNGAVIYSGLAALTLNGTGAVDTINVVSTAIGTATTINAGAGLDLFGPIDLTSISLAGLIINAGGDGEAVTLNTTLAGTVNISGTQVTRVGNGTVSYTGLGSLIVNGTALADTFNIANTAAGTAITVNVAGGLDIFADIDLTTIGLAGLTINAGGDGEALTLNTTTAGIVDVSSTQVKRSGNGAVIYSGLTTLVVNGTGNVDTFNIASTAAGTATTINAGAGLDLFAPIDLTSIGAAGLTVTAGGDGEALTLNVATAGTVNISGTQVTRVGNGTVNYTGLTSLIVTGTANADTFNIVNTAAGTATTVNAGGGLDVFADIDLTQIGLAGLTINAGGDSEALTLNTTLAGTVDVSSTQVKRSGNGAVIYSGLATLVVNGTGNVDTFNVASTAATTATTINALGGLDVFADIDLTTIGLAGLTINAGGDTETLTLNTTTAGIVDVSNTQVKRSGNGPVVYSGLATLVVNGTGNVDTFNIASTAAGTTTTINADAGLDLFAAIDLTSIGAAGLTVNAGGDGEALTLNTTAAGTVDLLSTKVQRSGNGAVNYSGLTSLIVNGTSSADTFNIANTAAGTATTVNADAGLDLFAAIDLTTIGLAGLTVNAGGDGEALTLNTTTAGTVSISSTQVQRTTNGAVAYSGLANLAVNGTGGVDTFNIASTASDTATVVNADAGLDLFGNIALTSIGLAGLTINAGGDGEALTLNATTAGTVTVSNALVQRSGNGAVNYTGLAALTVNGTIGGDTFNVLSINTATNTTINALGGLDAFGNIDLTTIGTAGLTLNAGGDGESLTLNTTVAGTVDLSSTVVQRSGNGPVTYSGLAHLTVNGTNLADTFNIASTAVNTETTVNAGDGLDLFAAIDLTTIGAAGLTINADGDGEALTLNTTTAGTVDLSSTQVQRNGNGPVTYSGLSFLTVNGTAGVDTFNVASTAANTETTVNAVGGLDVFAPINLTTIGTAGLNLNAGGDGESLVLNATTAGTVNISSTTVQRNGNGPINYTGLSNLAVNGTSGVDTFLVTSTFVTTATVVNAGASNDLFTLGNAGSLDGFLGMLAIHGDANLATPTTTLTCGPTTNTLAVGDTLQIDDTATSAGSLYTLNLATFLRTGIATVSFDGLETLVLDAGTAGDTINIATTVAQTSLTVNGNGGADTINFADNGTGSNVTINGGAEGDTLNVQAVATASIVLANGGSGDDTVNVSSDAPANAGTLDSIVGALCVDAGSNNDRIILSDSGQVATANSNVIVNSDRITGFAGATNNSTIFYKSSGNLELTLVGSDTLVDKFRVQLSAYPKTPSLVVRFDGKSQTPGGMDRVRIDGTSAADFMNVGTFASANTPDKKYGFRLQNIECLQMFGGAGNDTLVNDTAVSSLIDGADGKDFLSGGSAVDVIFGGNGVDTIFGNDGDDYLFGDHEFNNRNPRVKSPSDNDTINGGTGKDTIVILGKDFVDAGGQTGDTIIGSAKGLTPLDWLRARFLTASGKNVDAAIKAALQQACTKL